jgi:mono/diheme cytochrome c family protein
MKSHMIACCGALGALLIAAAPLFAVQEQAHQKSAQGAVQHNSLSQSSSQEEGQRIFEQNCARCHNAPDGFSTRITGTIVRHMRVRANLSQHDEQVLLHYFNQ